MTWLAWLLQMLCLFLISLTLEASNFSSSALSPSVKPIHCSNFDSAALLQFKSTFSVKNDSYKFSECYVQKCYPKTDSWKEGTDCCKWDGVACDSATGFVIGLDLSCSWLYGTITSNSTLFLLRHLQWLNLAYNNFIGSKISPRVGGFASLTHLNLSSSEFSGKVPQIISHLSKLVSIDLSYNDRYHYGRLEIEDHTFIGLVQNLTEVRILDLHTVNISTVDLGSLRNLSNSISDLSLGDCQLTGKFPQNVFRLPNLRVLKLEANSNLFGYLPKTNWSSPLEYLSLWSTSFFGELPDSLSNLESLEVLDLSFSNFSGSLPTSLGNLSQLTLLDLSHNQFSGQISFSLAKLTQLEYLDLSNNRLVGFIPDQVSLFHKIYFLDLSNNLLNGTLPTWLFNLSTLETLHLQNNQLTGLINELQQKSFISLNLGYNNFSGIINVSANYNFSNLLYLSLPSCKLGQFPKFLMASTNLSSLDLSNNDIHGNVPEWFWEVGISTLTHLNLSGNFFTNFEKIPWNNILTLDLNSNLLEGNLPSLPSTTTVFSMSNNSLNGAISSQICNASNLWILDLSHNNLSGILPQCIFNFSASLVVVNLQMNKFVGTIPSSIAEFCGLKYINFNGNQLEGRLPTPMAQCRKIEVLNLGNNKIKDTFPHWLERLPKLQVLILRSNQFYGLVDGCKSGDHCFSKLQILDLSSNNFTGLLPRKYIENLKSMKIYLEDISLSYLMGYGYNYESFYYSINVTIKGSDRELKKIFVTFISIDLSNNKFEGEIPRAFGELVFLKGLNLSHNKLSGHIPLSMKNLTSLEWLDISSNMLVGTIPEQLVELTSLSSFNVSYNQLNGSIPQGKQFNTFDNGSYEGNLGLCGFPLTKACNEIETKEPTPSTIASEFEDGFGWKDVLLGYVCGFVFGGAIGYLMIQGGKTKRLAILFNCKHIAS